MTIRTSRYGPATDCGPGHAEPLPASGERHTRGAETDPDDCADIWYWQDIAVRERRNDGDAD